MVAVYWWSYKLVWNRNTQHRREGRTGCIGWRCRCLLWQVQTTGNTGSQQEQETPSRERRLQRERIKNALYSKDLQGRNEGDEKGKQDREQRA